MTARILILLLSAVVAGCSKHSPKAGSQAQEAAQPNLPFPITVVEGSETTGINGIKAQALTLLGAKNYESLDSLATKLRDSKQCFADGVWALWNFFSAFDPGDEASEAEFKERFATLRDWENARPASIAVRVALANVLVSYAWKARGSGWANAVGDEKWRLFFRRLNEASAALNGARKLREQCPCWWSVLLITDLGLQVDRRKYDADFNAAVKAWPDYAGFYFRRAFFLLPRWNGAEGEWEKDLAQSADRIGGEKGDMLYARVVWSLRDYITDPPNPFQKGMVSWSRVDKGFGVVLEQFPDSIAAKNERIQLASLAGDYPAACKYFEETGGKCDLSVWRSKEKLMSFVDWFQRQPR